MRLRSASVFLLAALSSHACNTAAPSSADTLRLRFPDRAASVLERGSPLASAAEGFSAGKPAGFRAFLPQDGARPVVLSLPGGFEARVHEREVSSPAIAEGPAAVSYARSGGKSFWSMQPAGAEEWILLDAGLAVADRTVATWDVEGASIRQVGEAVEVWGGPRTTRIRVTAPEAFTASGRRVTAKLLATSSSIELSVDAGGEAVLVDPVWAPAHTMITPREHHTATVLMDGTVLVVGGISGGMAVTAAAEIYDPIADTWTAAASLIQPRSDHTATLLGSGKVLVAGGSNGVTPLPSGEVYDPTANTWTATQPLNTARTHHTASLVGNGLVLIAGGSVGFTLKTTELYSPTANAFASGPNMSTGRAFHTATVLGDGTVLVAGGYSGAPSAEVFDPVAASWTPTVPMNAVRTAHTATLLADGTVLVAGGFGGLASAEVYDPVAKTWTAVGSMTTGRSQHAASALTGGNVLVTGGVDSANTSLASVELYDPMVKAWASATPLAAARAAHTGTALGDGSVLAAGGDEAGVTLASAELYTAVAQGAACTGGGDCATGFCVNGVCCDKACGGGMTGGCSVCSVAAGATADGTCTLLDSVPCDDGNKCTQTDTCNMGMCVGSSPVVCTAPDDCHTAGTCNPTTGQCGTAAAKMDGTTCDPGTKCMTNAQCAAGACKGTAVKCTAADECHDAGTCDPTTGQCSMPAKADGTLCSVGTCQSGVCTKPTTTTSSSSSSSGGAGGAGGGATTTGTGTGTGTGGSSKGSGGCGCSFRGDPAAAGALWMGIALLFASRRRSRSR